MYHNDPLSVRQALPFIIISLKLLDLEKSHAEIIKSMSRYLIENINDLEPRFEYGEALVGLGYICGDYEEIKNIVIREQNKILDILKSSDMANMDDIFQLNWYAQSLIILHQQHINYQDMKEHCDVLSDRIIKLSSQYDDHTESNYLVVAFESLCGLYGIWRVYGDRNNNISDKIIRLMKMIENRINYMGLVEFIDGRSRIDITGHFMNGIHHLVKNLGNTDKKTNTSYKKYIVNKHKYNILHH